MRLSAILGHVHLNARVDRTRRRPVKLNQNRSLTMKHFLCSAVALSFLASGAMAQDKTLTISVYSFGKDAMDEAVFSPFEEVCGCDVVIETGRSVERMA